MAWWQILWIGLAVWVVIGLFAALMFGAAIREDGDDD